MSDTTEYSLADLAALCADHGGIERVVAMGLAVATCPTDIPEFAVVIPALRAAVLPAPALTA